MATAGPALSSAADALVSLPKLDLTGMNFPNQGRKTVAAERQKAEDKGGRGKRGVNLLLNSESRPRYGIALKQCG